MDEDLRWQARDIAGAFSRLEAALGRAEAIEGAMTEALTAEDLLGARSREERAEADRMIRFLLRTSGTITPPPTA